MDSLSEYICCLGACCFFITFASILSCSRFWITCLDDVVAAFSVDTRLETVATAKEQPAERISPRDESKGSSSFSSSSSGVNGTGVNSRTLQEYCNGGIIGG